MLLKAVETMTKGALHGKGGVAELFVAEDARDGHALEPAACGRGGGQRGHFQHHFFGVDQLQVAACQAFVRAVDKDGLLAHQRFRAGVRQCIEQQGGITGSGVRIRGRGAVKQLIAIDSAGFIHDGLAGNDGDVFVDRVNRWRCSFGGVLFRCARHGSAVMKGGART